MMKLMKKARKHFKRWYRRSCFSFWKYSNTSYTHLGHKQMSSKRKFNAD
jgi:hypothetical protein